MARGSRCQLRSSTGMNLRVETALESGETVTAQDGKDKSESNSVSEVKGFERRRTYLEVILNTQKDSESEQQNDVDMVGADFGANGAAPAASGASAGTGVTSVTGENQKAQEEAKRRMERVQAALMQLGSGDDLKEVRDNLNQEMSRAKKASEPQHLANDIEGKAAWVSRDARWLNELEADIAKRQAHLIQKRRDFQVEIQELDLAKNVSCAGGQENGFRTGKTGVAHSSRAGGGERAAESGSTWPKRDRALEKVA